MKIVTLGLVIILNTATYDWGKYTSDDLQDFKEYPLRKLTILWTQFNRSLFARDDEVMHCTLYYADGEHNRNLFKCHIPHIFLCNSTLLLSQGFLLQEILFWGGNDDINLRCPC